MRPQRTCVQPHGTVARYVSGCSCFECCEEWRAYQRELKERPGTIDASPVREHVCALIATGFSTRAIAEHAQVAYNTVRGVRDGWWGSIRRDTAEAILSVSAPLPGPSGAWIPAAPTLALIRSLRRSHSLAAIARAAGLNSHKSLPQPGQRQVMARTAARVERAAEKLGRSRSVEITDALRDAIETDPRSINEIEDASGLKSGAIHHVLRRGSCTERTLHAVISGLGLTAYDLESNLTRERNPE